MSRAAQLHERVQAAIRAVELASSGCADIGSREDVAEAVRAAGYTVIRSTDVWHLPTFKAFSKSAVETLKTKPFCVSTFRPIRLVLDLHA